MSLDQFGTVTTSHYESLKHKISEHQSQAHYTPASLSGYGSIMRSGLIVLET
jgi:hypothetical protein